MIENSHRPTIVLKGEIVSFDRPKVMGIINVTPDSFFSGSRTMAREEITARVMAMKSEGADMLDIGGYSSRPGAEDISPDEEYSRLARGLEVIRDHWEDAIVSVDTFRADVARKCVEQWGVSIINDISGGDLDPEMFGTVADLKCAYILMHMRGNPSNMQTLTDYPEGVTADVVKTLGFKIAKLRSLGVADIIVDPGFGFAKTVDQNYELLSELNQLRELGCPVLAALSHKSMIFRHLGITPDESEEGTIVLDTVALLNGADMIRVHNARAAVQTVSLLEKLRQTSQSPPQYLKRLCLH